MAADMAMNAVFLNIDDKHVASTLREAMNKLDGAKGETVLDFSSVGRIDSSALRTLEEFARMADEKEVRIGLRGVNAGVYKVLKVMKLTKRFSFLN